MLCTAKNACHDPHFFGRDSMISRSVTRKSSDANVLAVSKVSISLSGPPVFRKSSDFRYESCRFFGSLPTSATKVAGFSEVFRLPLGKVPVFGSLPTSSDSARKMWVTTRLNMGGINNSREKDDSRPRRIRKMAVSFYTGAHACRTQIHCCRGFLADLDRAGDADVGRRVGCTGVV